MSLHSKILLLLIFVCKLAFCQEWVKTDITSFASIDFPVESEFMETQQEVSYNASDDDALYIVTMQKLRNSRVTNLNAEQTQELYEGVIQGALAASNGVLVSKKEIEANGVIGMEVKFTTPPSPVVSNLRFKRIFFVNQTIINIDFFPFTDEEYRYEKKKQQFFNSFLPQLDEIEATMNSSSKALNTDDGSYMAGYNIGFIVGKIVSLLLLIGLIIGLVVFIKYIRKRQKGQQPEKPIQKQTKDKISTKICSKCETEQSSNSKYCNRCGYELPKSE